MRARDWFQARNACPDGSEEISMRQGLKADFLDGLMRSWAGKDACMVCNGSPRGVSYDLLWNITMWIGEIIAVDSGLEWLERAGISPELIVGDLDSVNIDLYSRYEAMGVSSVLANPMKDDTDLEMALSSARDHFQSKVVVVNYSGGYLDQELASLGSMGRCGLPVAAVDDHMAVIYLAGPEEGADIDDGSHDFESAGNVVPSRLRLAQIGLEEGDEYSVIAYDGAAVVTQAGVHWPQESFEYEGLSGRGIDNIVESPDAQVVVESGKAMVIIEY